MTCLEKLKQMHPEWSEGFEGFIENDCPNEHGILDNPDYCDPFVTCKECWNRQIPGTESDEPHIRDSGSRTEFSTGAVRDIQKGKGRCDLMPLDVVSGLLGGRDDGRVRDAVIHAIAQFQQTGDIGHLYRAIRIFTQTNHGSICIMLLEVSKHFEEGAEKYGEGNWQKGLPVKCYINSAVRHYLKHSRGDTDEPHNRAFCWNLMCAIWTCEHKPELNDYVHGKLGFNPDDLMGEYEEENE